MTDGDFRCGASGILSRMPTRLGCGHWDLTQGSLLPAVTMNPQVGLVYMFNLIVGTGALTMPRAFATAGWVVSLSLISFLGFMRWVLVMPLALQ